MIYTTRAPFCHLCGRRVSGRYVRYETGLTVCAACEASRPRCHRCNVPLGDDIIAAQARSSGPRLCVACQKAAARCSCCGQAIIGTFYTFEELLPSAEARRFCSNCVQRGPACDLCRAPVLANARPLADGQWRCALCASDMVMGQGPTRAIFSEAVVAFNRVTGSPLRETPDLRVVGRREMNAVRQRHSAASPDTTPDSAGHHVLGYYLRANGHGTVYVEMGLPRALLLGTLAHELGHAWQTEHNPKVSDPLLCEGFAEWAAHRVLVDASEQTLAARATRRDDIYGRGLRHFLKLEASHGRPAVLKAIESAGR